MKRMSPLYLTVCALIVVSLSGCRDRIYQERTYTANVPVYMSYADFRTHTIEAEPAKTLTNPGKIYFKDQYLFINDRDKGIHIIDNSTPSNPQNIGYLPIPGNVDMAIKGNILYADSRMDMLVIDIADPMAPRFVDRKENVFPAAYPQWDEAYPIQLPDPNEGVVVGWEIETVTERRNVSDPWSGQTIFMENNNTFQPGGGFAADFSVNETVATTAGVSVGVSGSMARMLIIEDNLYAVNNNVLQVFDINNLENPVHGGNMELNRTVETISSMEEYLFIGTTTGMLVYTIANPNSPEFVSTFDHATMCDPVVAQGDYAYVTLRGGRFCGGWNDRMDIINISNIQQPALESSYSMSGPYGLGIDGNTLFVCDGTAGLKVFDVSNPSSAQLTDDFPGIHAYDVIPINNLLLMIGDDGLYQYNYAAPNDMQLLSHLPVETL